MIGAVEAPFDAGRCPLTRSQWDTLVAALAELCERYDIDVTPRTVLTHAEVQATLGISQRGKRDVAALPFDPSVPRTAAAVGTLMRAQVVDRMIDCAVPEAPERLTAYTAR